MKPGNLNSYYKLPILDGLELLNAKNHLLNFPFHSHNTFNITLVYEQIFSTKLQNNILHAPSGCIAITNPNEVHATICDSRMGTTFFTFYISPDVLSKLNNNKPVYFEKKIINDTSLFQQLSFLAHHLNQHSVYIENLYLETLKSLVVNYSGQILYQSKQNTNFQRFLEEETFEKFSLEKTANKFGLNKYKFIRLFKNETGLTPNNYIILKRIEKCKQLLKTHNNLLEIAVQTGFYDATHLCMHFKKITGVTPLTYHQANSALQYLTMQ